MIKTFFVLLFFAITPAHALEHCTRALLGDGPELAPMVCTEVTSDRGTIMAERPASAIRSPHAGGPYDSWAWRARRASLRALGPHWRARLGLRHR